MHKNIIKTTDPLRSEHNRQNRSTLIFDRNSFKDASSLINDSSGQCAEAAIHSVQCISFHWSGFPNRKQKETFQINSAISISIEWGRFQCYRMIFRCICNGYGISIRKFSFSSTIVATQHACFRRIRSYWVLVKVSPLFLRANEHNVLLFILPAFFLRSHLLTMFPYDFPHLLFCFLHFILHSIVRQFRCGKPQIDFSKRKKQHFSLFIHILSVVKFSLFMRMKIKCKIKVAGCCFLF